MLFWWDVALSASEVKVNNSASPSPEPDDFRVRRSHRHRALNDRLSAPPPQFIQGPLEPIHLIGDRHTE
jgi:hypothetical protein